MFINATDTQVVGEVLSTLWSTLQHSPVDMQVILKNSGVNTMNYRLQEHNGTAWVDMGAAGTDYNDTLSPGEVKTVTVTSNYPQVQMVGNASGGAFLDFTIARHFNRSSGGALPLLAL